MTRLQPDLLQSVDTWRGNQLSVTTRPEAVRKLATIGLATTPIAIELLVHLRSAPFCPETDALIEELRRIVGLSGKLDISNETIST